MASDFDPTVLAIRAALKGRAHRVFDLPKFRRASVLIPILQRPHGATMLFTRRTETVGQHKGQISFPGGRVEKGESDEAAALREAQEEVALDPTKVEIVAQLDDQPSVSWYLVSPFVGIVRDPPEAFVGQASEVSEPFEVPLAALLDRSHYRSERWKAAQMPEGSPVDDLMTIRADLDEVDEATQTYAVHFFEPGDGRIIWGLTARILKQLLDLAFRFSD